MQACVLMNKQLWNSSKTSQKYWILQKLDCKEIIRSSLESSLECKEIVKTIDEKFTEDKTKSVSSAPRTITKLSLTSILINKNF